MSAPEPLSEAMRMINRRYALFSAPGEDGNNKWCRLDRIKRLYLVAEKSGEGVSCNWMVNLKFLNGLRALFPAVVRLRVDSSKKLVIDLSPPGFERPFPRSFQKAARRQIVEMARQVLDSTEPAMSHFRVIETERLDHIGLHQDHHDIAIN